MMKKNVINTVLAEPTRENQPVHLTRLNFPASSDMASFKFFGYTKTMYLKRGQVTTTLTLHLIITVILLNGETNNDF